MTSEPNRPPLALAVIPARGGSKRLPRKNILPLAGHPVIAYTIRAAQGATALTHWLVSTDDEEIADVARRYGAPVPFMRPASLAGDKDRNTVVLTHALDFMERKHGLHYDIIVLLQPTCPIRQSAHVDQAVTTLWASPLDTLASVRGPIRKRDPNIKAIRDGVLEPFNPDEDETNWESAYIYNAAVYAMKRNYLLSENRFTARVSVPLVMDDYHSTDIDEDIDLIYAEALMTHRGLSPFSSDTDAAARKP